MAAYRRVYDSRQLQLQVAKTAKNRDQLRNHTLGNRVWATFTFLQQLTFVSHPVCMDACMTGEAAAVRQRVLSVQDVGQRPPRDIRTLDQDLSRTGGPPTSSLAPWQP